MKQKLFLIIAMKKLPPLTSSQKACSILNILGHLTSQQCFTFNQADDEPDNQADDEPDNQADDEPDNQADDEPDNQADDEPDNQADDEPDNQADDEPDNQADDEPDNQADNEPDNQADDEPDNQADDEPDNQADIFKIFFQKYFRIALSTRCSPGRDCVALMHKCLTPQKANIASLMNKGTRALVA